MALAHFSVNLLFALIHNRNGSPPVYDGDWMQRLPCLVIAVTLAPFVTVAQQKSAGRVPVLTVCEALGNMNQYAETAVAIVGRLERSVSLVDHYEFLSQDRCEHQVITHGYAWSNRVQVLTGWEDGMPKPPTDRPKLQEVVVAGKLFEVRKTTGLGSHDEPQYGAGRHVTIPTVSNHWVVIYGRMVRSARLDEDCGAVGCGGDDVPLILITKPYQVHRLSDDGRPLSERE